MKRWIFLAVTFTAISSVGLYAENKADAISVDAYTSASTKNHYLSSSLSGNLLLDTIRKKEAAFVLSTTNPDGSPNAAVFIPGVVSDSVLRFGLVKNQTRLNIERTGVAVLTVYRFMPEQPQGRQHNGARLRLRLINEPEQNKNKGFKVIRMEIREILPVG